MCVFFISARGSLLATSAKNFYEEPGSTLDRCPQRAERNFPCERKEFPIKVAWRKQEAATQIRKRLQKGKKTASALLAGGKVLGTLVNYQMEEEVLPCGWTLLRAPPILSVLS